MQDRKANASSLYTLKKVTAAGKVAKSAHPGTSILAALTRQTGTRLGADAH